MKKILHLLLAVAVIAALTSCSASQTPTEDTDVVYIAIVSKGFQHQFWQTVYAGSKAAAADYNVEISFEGPPSETNIDMQVDMVGAALSKNPAALCLAAIDSSRLSDKLAAAKAAKIPVIGFDSGIPDAPEEVVVSTACTNNYAAGELAAMKMFEEASVQERIAVANADMPVVIGVLSQDAVSFSIVERTKGFTDKLFELINSLHPGAVTISGHNTFAKPVAGGSAAIVEIKVMIPPTTEYTDAQINAQNLINGTQNLVGIFCSNEGAVTGLLAATDDGKSFDRENGEYKNITVVGFDAGISQKQAVKNRYFYGSITQDPFRIGYLAVELAYKAINGETIDEVVDTGCKFYNFENINDPDIAQLVYD